MSDEFDLDALENEAGDKPFPFQFGGEQYELPPRMDMLAIAALSDGDFLTALRRLLGAEQLERMQNSKATLTDRKLAALFDRYSSHLGSTMGEPSASTNSSRSTARR